MKGDSTSSRLGAVAMMGYGAGDFACGLIWNTTIMFLMFFYTDVFGLGAAAAGTMLLVVRILDGACDIGIGLWVDRTTTRFGRCRPFVLFGAPCLSLMAVACFYVPALPPGGKLIYAYVTYLGLMLSYSVVNIPYSAMPALMTPDSDQRTRLAGVRMAFATAGWIVVGSATLPLVGLFGQGKAQRGHLLTMTLLAVVALLLLWTCFATTREAVRPKAVTVRHVRGDLRAVLSSRAWWSLALALMMTFVGIVMPSGCTVYYFTYVVKQPELVSGFFLLANIGNLAGLFISDRLTRRFCKRTVIKWATVPASLLPLLFLVVDPSQPWQVYVLGFVLSAAGMVCAPIFFSMAADVADSIELTTGRRVVGLSGSALTLAVKLGGGLASALTGLALSFAGYRSGVEQSPVALETIRACMSLGPAAAYGLTLVALQFYPYGRREIEGMAAHLAEERAHLPSQQRHAAGTSAYAR